MENIQEITITDKQRKLICHALGMDRLAKRPNRNMYYADANDPDWADLIEKKLAVKKAGWVEESRYYKVTFTAAKMVYTKITEKYFNTLR